jgi:hypothetical protein
VYGQLYFFVKSLRPRNNAALDAKCCCKICGSMRLAVRPFWASVGLGKMVVEGGLTSLGKDAAVRVNSWSGY